MSYRILMPPVWQERRACLRAIVSVVALRDTSPKFASLHRELYRAADAAHRVQVAVDLSEAVRRTAIAGIRQRHPEYSEEQVRWAFLELVYARTSSE